MTVFLSTQPPPRHLNILAEAGSTDIHGVQLMFLNDSRDPLTFPPSLDDTTKAVLCFVFSAN